MSADPPLVTRPAAAAPRPGLFAAALLTVAFAVVLFGSILVIFFGAWFVLLADGQIDPTAPASDAPIGSTANLPRPLLTLLAWLFPVGYAAGLAFTLLVFRAVAGRGWTREVGLRRLPLAHLGLAALALPAFVILSDGLAQFLFWLFRMEHLLDQTNQLGDVFRGFHPAFVLLAIGVGPGVVEELWCRGFLGRGLVGRHGWVAGVGLASLFFGLLHLYPPPYVVVTAVMGACLHYAYACSRSLWVPIAMHTANNGFAGLAAVGAVPTGGMERAVAAYPALVFPLAAVVLFHCGWAAWTARATAAGPRGVMVPPGGVTNGRIAALPGLLALASAAALAVVLAVA